MIHHFAILLSKNYLTIQVGKLQRIHRQYNRYESALDDTLIGIESLSSGYLTHHILDPKILSRYLEAIADDMEDTVPDYEPVSIDIYQYCYIVGLGLNCKFIDLLFKCSVIKFIKISSFLGFIVSEIIYSQTDTIT